MTVEGKNMSIDFTPERWGKVKENARHWWAGELDRPLIQIRLGGADPGRPAPDLPAYPFAARYDLSVPAGAIIDRWDYELSRVRYLGDAFPAIWPNFGPGVAAAFSGARLEADERTVWFHFDEDKEAADLEFAYAPDNVWLRRIKDICRAAVERWQGLVQVGMTDLGGVLDILSTFRPGEKLLLDLYDDPESVQRLIREIIELWWRYFAEIDAVLRPANPGYTAWTPIFSSAPYYMLQCDFCYMIGPEMFDEFVQPELAAMCRRLAHPFYHLDGSGQLCHLDSLLAIPELKGVQWIPGAGQPDMGHWPEVYRKIRAAGKLIQITGRFEVLNEVAEQIGGAEGIVMIASGDISQQAAAEALLKKYGALCSA